MKERVKNVLNYKKPAFWVVAASLMLVIIVGVCFLTDPAANPKSNPEPPDSVPEFSNMNAANPHEATPEYTGGALLYQSMYLSSYFSSGSSSYASVIEDGGTLIITDSFHTTTRYILENTYHYSVAEFYEEFEFLALEEEQMGRKLLPEDVSSITCRIYVSEELNADGYESREAIWEVSLSNGGKRMWIGGSGRLFALIDLNEAFNQPLFIAPIAALWTYDPSLPTAIPIRFDLEGEVNVWTSDGELALEIKDDGWTDFLTVEKGQTIYWMPSRESAPIDGAALSYSYCAGELERWTTDAVSLRPAMDYEGLYGGKTYGVSQDWLGMLSSRFHGTQIVVDGGVLMVCLPTLEFTPIEPSDGVGDIEEIEGSRVQYSVVWDAASGE